MKIRPFANPASVRKTAITTRVLELIHQVCVPKRVCVCVGVYMCERMNDCICVCVYE